MPNIKTTTELATQGFTFASAIAALVAADPEGPVSKIFSPLFAWAKPEGEDEAVPTKVIGCWIKRKPKQSFSSFLSVLDDGEGKIDGRTKSFLSYIWKQTLKSEVGETLKGGSICFYANPDKLTFSTCTWAKDKAPKGAKAPKGKKKAAKKAAK